MCKALGETQRAGGDTNGLSGGNCQSSADDEDPFRQHRYAQLRQAEYLFQAGDSLPGRAGINLERLFGDPNDYRAALPAAEPLGVRGVGSVEPGRDEHLESIGTDPGLTGFQGPEKTRAVRRGQKTALERATTCGATVLQWDRSFPRRPASSISPLRQNSSLAGRSKSAGL